MPDHAAVQPPTLPNPVGTNVNILASIMLVLMTIVVGMRGWGRYRYKTPGRSMGMALGKSSVWILWSDMTIIVAWVCWLIPLTSAPRCEALLGSWSVH